MTPPTRGRAGARLATFGAALGLLGAACVKIEPGPNGIASARLDPAPRAIAVGDSLRDADGVAMTVHGVVFDESGNPVPTAVLRFTYVPVTPAAGVVDTALVVDSVTGAVRAAKAVVASRGYVAVRFAPTLQLVDTLEIVPTPDSVAIDTAASKAADTTKIPRLTYDCASAGTVLLQLPSSLPDTFNVNALGPFVLRVYGDSSGTTVAARRWLVRWRVDSAPPNTTVPATVSGDTVSPIAIVASAADRRLSVDTADAQGTSTVRLRIRPSLLGPRAVPDSAFVVRVSATVSAVTPGTPGVRRLTRQYRVRLRRGTPSGSCS